MSTSLLWHLLWPLSADDATRRRDASGADPEVGRTLTPSRLPRFEPASAGHAPERPSPDKYEALAIRRRRAQIAARRALGG